MTNIWGFLLQTVHVSIIAIMLMGLKIIFKDKLSPRWQYGIWIILVICIVLPVKNNGTYIFPKVNTYIETFKTIAEKNLNSQFISFYELISNGSFLPWIKGIPHSISDILFVIYVIGVIVYLFKYIGSYIYLKTILKKGREPVLEVYKQIDNVCQKYQLQVKKVTVIEGLSSAFVVGIINPILVLPTNKVDDKIILHELLHLKYKDYLHCVGWTFFQCIHWCNPVLRYVFHQINNDMESLCDQRVLELLQGEERRDYGRILLSMTNDKYPYIFATTAISNGGKNIKKRIEAIARFKKYPKGMALVSLCIVILLIPLACGGTTYASYIYSNQEDGFYKQLSYTSSRMVQCHTIASAIDLYAKGILTNEELYLTTVMTNEQYKNYNSILNSRPTNIISHSYNSLYQVINLTEINNSLYEAFILFENNTNEYDEELEGDIGYTEYSIIPIQIIKENGWKVKQNGSMIKGKTESEYCTITNIADLSLYKHIIQNTSIGQLDISVFTSDVVSNISNQNFYGYNNFSYEPNFDADFDQKNHIICVRYADDNQENRKHIGLEIGNLDNMSDEIEYSFSEDEVASNGGDRSSEHSSDFKRLSSYENINLKLNHVTDIHKGYWIRVWADEKIVDEIRFEVGENND